ncbi:hypothetical protein FQN52_000425 [Onygenales sp. PD_12]|nr:hypothetical protein FQN52_000425 [Onygenales sp. PD_12]
MVDGEAHRPTQQTQRLVSRMVYGESRCHDWAWKDMIPAHYHAANTKVGSNADNYAWFFDYNWFHRKWSWDADGSQPFKKRMIERDEGIGKPNILNEPVNPVEEGDLVLGQSTIPANCHIEDGDVESAVCNYADEGYDVFIDRLDEPFEARNSECILS